MDITEKRIEKTRIYTGKKVNLDVVEVLLPNENRTKREILERRRCSVILVIRNGNIVVEGQYRQPFEREVFSLPAGKADPGETPLETAKRELEEETGLVAKDWTCLGEFLSAPAYSTEIVTLFLAERTSEGKLKRDEDEFLNLYDLPLEDFEAAIQEGRIKDMRSVLSYYRYRDFCKSR